MKTIKFILSTVGLCMLIALGLTLSPAPHKALNWLKETPEQSIAPPDYIVVLGGGGIPSESGLMRCYSAAELYEEYPKAQYIVSLPADDDPEKSSVGRMKQELIMRGVPSTQIQMEYKGRNTHEQAVEIAKMLGEEGRLTQTTLIVSSPYHLRRALLCFKKQGFVLLRASGATSTGAEADMGAHTNLRYAFWNNLHLGIDIIREGIALQVYKLKGWI